MARWTRYFLPAGIRRLRKPIAMEAKLFARVWLNILLPWRLLKYRQILAAPRQNLHVGCGSRVFEGWTNLDMTPRATSRSTYAKDFRSETSPSAWSTANTRSNISIGSTTLRFFSVSASVAWNRAGGYG